MKRREVAPAWGSFSERGKGKEKIEGRKEIDGFENREGGREGGMVHCHDRLVPERCLAWAPVCYGEKAGWHER